MNLETIDMIVSQLATTGEIMNASKNFISDGNNNKILAQLLKIKTMADKLKEEAIELTSIAIREK